MKGPFALALLALAACTTAPSKGSLQVNISGLPAGSSASVQVRGPGGFSQALTASTPLANLALGSYTFTPGSVRKSGPTVDQVFTSPTKSVEVKAGTNPALELPYTPRPGSGQLWLSLEGDTGLRAYSSDQLAASGSPVPALEGGGVYYGMAFDPEGNLWGVNRRLARVPAAQLGSSAASDLSIPLSAGLKVVFWGIAFDASGNAWVAAYKDTSSGSLVNGNRVLMFRKADLGSASATPYLTLQSSGLNAPLAIAFDALGNLWAVNEPGTLVRYNAASLGGSGGVNVDPACTFSAPGSLIDLAFDQDGNVLLVSNNTSSIYKVAAASLQSCVGTAPLDPVLSLSGSAIQSPYGLALDNSGNLWVSNYSPNYLSQIPAADLAQSGNQTVAAAVRLEVVSDSSIYRPVFSPAPLGLGLY